MGTTLVHEVGHYFSLQHTYGTCGSYTDGCNDTPAVSGLPNALCGTNNNTKGVCVTGQTRMWQNYLDYTDDACMNVFTNDQATKMQNYIANTTNYTNLTSSTNINAVSCASSNFVVSTSSTPIAGGNTTGGGTFASGTSVTVTATANSGYTFTKWTENGTQVSTNASYTFSLSANRSLVANFTQNTVSNFVVSTSSTPIAGGNTTGGGTYASGTSITVTATANSGYTFTKWTENGTQVSTNASYTFSLSANRNLVANFTQNTSSVSELDGSNLYGFSIYPNPVSSELTIKVSNENIKEIKVINILGDQLTILKDLYAEEVKVNTSSYLNGVYYIEVKLANDFVLTKKIIKQ
jgi:uncharacterized repeat protein (TIGR02543 family)